MIVGVLKALFTVDASKFVSGMETVKSSTASATKSVEKANRSFTKFGVSVAAAGTLIVASTVKLASMAKEIEAIDHKLRFASGGVENANKAFSFLIKESNRLGISLGTLTSEFANFTASARSSSLSGQEVEKIFTAVAEASAVLRMDTSTTHLTFLALSQMMSKTVVSTEELKRQLGDHLPGAVQIMARALGVGTRELLKMLEKGELLAEDVLPKFAEVLSKDVAAGVKDLENSLSAAIGRLDTAWFLLKKRFLGEGSLLFKALKVTIDGLTSSIRSLGDVSSANNITIGLLGTPQMLQKAGDAINGVRKELEIAHTEIAREAVQKRKEMDYAAMQDRIDVMETAFDKEKALFEENNKHVLDFFQNTLDSSLKMMQDWVSGGKLSIKDFATSIINDLMRVVHEIAIAGPMMDSLRGFLSQNDSNPSASVGGFFDAITGAIGNMFSGATGYAKGGIISEPIAGVGLSSGKRYTFGEEGAEVVAPLNRSKTSASSGSSNVNITINAIDSKSVTELMRTNPQAVTIPIIEALTGGDRHLSAAMRGAI